MRYLIVFSLLFFVGVNTQSQNIATGKKVLEYLADDKVEGRAPGTKGGKLAREFLDQWFYDNWMGRFSFGYQQDFDISTDIEIDKVTKLKISGQTAVLNRDFLPFVFSAEGSDEKSLVYGGTTLADSGVNVKDKWVLVYVTGKKNNVSFRQLISEIMYAREQKAAGVVIASQKDLTSDSEFFPFKFSRATVSLDLPVVQISRSFLQQVLLSNDLSLRKLRKMKLNKINHKLRDLTISYEVKFHRIKKTTANVASFIEGDESNEWVVVGAHYDHLGYGGYGSGSRAPDETAVHNGADDNASGTAMVIMMAEYYKKNPPKSNMAFVLFSAEEMGLLGSKYFVENLPFPKEKIKAMVNFDMVGRVEDSVLKIIGVNTAKEFEPLLEQWQGDPLDLSLGEGGYSGSDQAAFYAENIPVLFFNSGLHDDYHTPNDDIEKINYEGMEWVAKLSVDLLDSLTSPSFEVNFEQGKERKEEKYRTTMKVKMGIMPDVAGAVKNGLGVDGVSAGGPADKAGIVKGDIIIQMGETKITNIYDYMHQLKKLDKGQELQVKIKRDEGEVELKVQF